tara:strand:- start:63778 stop:64251 length:474 start_codon:yes stop_codon:yes gene_type:complete
MKAIISIRASKNILKPELRKNYGDIVTLYRTDSVGSKSLKREFAKPYGYEIRNNEAIINGCDKKEFEKLFVGGQVSTLRNMFEESDQNKYYHAYIGKTVIGYEVFDDIDTEKYSIKTGSTPILSVDMFIITCHSDGTIDVTDAIVENRNKNIELILE